MKNFLMTLTLFSTLFASTHSNAIVGATNDNRALALTGLALMDLSTFVVAERRPVRYRRGVGYVGYTVYRVVTLPVLLVAGLVLLDDNGRFDISADITGEAADKANLSNEEKFALEDNIEEVNALFDSISMEVQETKASKQEKIELAKDLWEDYSQELDQNVMSGLVKVLNLKK